MKLEFSQWIGEKRIKFHGNPSNGSRGRTDGQPDRQTWRR